jgi:predicted RND superfamily exporter protein
VIGFLFRIRHVTVVAVAVLLVLLGLIGRKVSYEQSIGSFFADDDPRMSVYQKASAAFDDDNFVFLVYDDPALVSPRGLDRVAELAAAVGPDKLPGVLRVESLDAMPLVWALDDALVALDRFPPVARDLALNAAKKTIKNVDLKSNIFTVSGAVSLANDRGRERIKARLRHHPLFRGTVMDETGQTTAIVVRLRKTQEHNVIETVRRLRAEADDFAKRHGLGRPAVVGPPVLLADGFAAIEVDGRRLAVVGMILIAVVTLVAVHSVWWAIVPMIAGWTIWLATETILALLKIKLALSGGPLVAQIIVLTMPAASHLAIHFRDHRRREADPQAAGTMTLRAVAAPIFWTAVTGAIGYGALVTSELLPVQQFGTILGVCTLCSALLVMVLSPIAMRPPFPLEIPVREGSRSHVAGVMNRLTFWVHRHPGAILSVVVLVVVPLCLGIFGLEYETNYISLFRSETRVVKDYRRVEAKLGGIGVVELVVTTGPAVTPPVLDGLAQVERQIKALPLSDPRSIAQVLSVATVLDPEGRIAALPEDSQARIIANKLELIALSPQARLLRSFWNPRAGQARILVRLLEQQPAPTKARIFRDAEAAARASFGPSAFLTGLSYLMTKTTEGVIATQWGTFFWSALGILLMLTLAFRSVVLALLAILPTLLAVALVLGLMGWLSIKLDMATALVASVALGLSVDDTFHCLIQFHRMRHHHGFRESLFDSYRVSGPGVILSSLAVAIGFMALRASEFEPFVNFGTMVAIATAGSTMGNLVLLPACLTLGQRWASRAKAVPASVSTET